MKASKRHCGSESNRSLCTSFAMTLLTLLVLLTPLHAQPSSKTPQASTPPSASGQAESTAGDEGPVLSSSEIQQGAILLHFSHAEGGLRLANPGRGAFEIAGADHVWFPAEAHLVNGVLVVSTSLVQQPTEVRYLWMRDKTPVLFNGANLPAQPFYTGK